VRPSTRAAEPHSLRTGRGRLLLACAVAAIVILSAPFMSQIRGEIRTAFPGQFVPIVGSTIAVLIGVPLLVALARVRERRALRYGALGAAVVIGVAFSLLTRKGIPEVDVVERFHFVEFGIVTLLFYRAWRPLGDVSMFVLPVLAGLLVGTLEEWLQWFIPVRVGAMEDILLNSAAIASGLLFSVAVDPPAAFGAPARPGSLRRIGMFTAVVTIAIAAFFHTVHLGHEILDAEIGRFRSRYNAGELAQLSAARSREWLAHPPPLEIPRISREDQYMTEGVEHVRERNTLWGEGRQADAWLENRILEKYYAPVVDTPSYHSKTGHRWPDEQRGHAQAAFAAAADLAATYVSDSNPAPIHTWPKWLFWGCVLALAGVQLLLLARVERVNARSQAASAV
jgi:hypothetical protein